MAIRRLVLLANQYPYLAGDHVFVAAEIPALAAHFDEVVVFNYAQGAPAAMAEMPANVRFGGSLFGIPREDKIKALFAPSNLMNLAKVTIAEARTGRLSGHFRTFLAGTIAGMGLANDARLKAALYEKGVETTVYSFWGMGIGMLVPWIRSSVGSVNLRLHRYDLYEEESGYLPFRPSMFRRSNRILAISEESRSYLIKTYPGERLDGKITVRRLGSAAPPTAPKAAGTEAAGRDAEVNTSLVNTAGDDEGVPTIVSCSYVIPVKRVARILDALEKLPAETAVRWIHFGGGTLEDELRQRAADAVRPGLDIDIRGATPHAEILEYYRSQPVSALINVSASEGVPVSIMEAISHDIPVIATNVGGTTEIVGKDLKTGELLPADFSDEDLLAALGTVLSAKTGTYAPKELWAARYDGAVNAEATAQLIASKP